MAYQNPEIPWWFEAYQDSTILVAYVSNFASVYKSKPEAQLFFLHQLVQQLDAVVLRSGNKLWRMHAFSLPFYCVLCPQCNSTDHANVVFEVALELSMAAAKVNLPCGDPVDLRVGLASGSSSAGVIGATGVTFVVTGKIAQGAKHFAEHTEYLTASEETWRKLSATNRNRGQWCRSSLWSVPTVGNLPCLDYHIRPPKPTPPPARSTPTPEELAYTPSDISHECQLFSSSPSLWPWYMFSHPGIEVAYYSHLVARELTPSQLATVLLALLVMMSAHLRVAVEGPLPYIALRLALVGMPGVVLMSRRLMRQAGWQAQEATWVAMVVARKALVLRPALAPQAMYSWAGSLLLPHLADLLDCMVGMAICNMRFTLQLAACMVAWLSSVSWTLVQLHLGAAGARDMLHAWVFASASGLLQAWVLVQWEQHRRRQFLRILAQEAAPKGKAKGKAPAELPAAHPSTFLAPTAASKSLT